MGCAAQAFTPHTHEAAEGVGGCTVLRGVRKLSVIIITPLVAGLG